MNSQRKPVRRAFTGLVGLPPEPDEAVAATPAPVIVSEPALSVAPTEPSKKRGRPTKGSYVMSNKERAAKSYDLKKEKQAHKMRRDLVADLMKTYKRMAADPVLVKKHYKSFDAACENKIAYLRKLHDELLMCSYDELITVKSTLEDTPDQRGRLHNERSGERGRLSGMSEIERLIEMPKDPQAAWVAAFTPDYLKFLAREHDTFTRMIKKYTHESGTDVVCRLCATDLSPEDHVGPPTCVQHLRLNPSDARFHFEQEYGRGEKLAEKVRLLTEAGAECLTSDAQKALNNSLHYRLFFEEKKQLAKEQKQKEREFRRISPEGLKQI